MSIIQRATTLLERRTAGEWGDSSIPSNGMLGSPVAGVSVTEQSAMQIAAVWSCVFLRADAVATLPINQFSKGDETKIPHPPAPVLLDPWPEITPVDWYTQLMVSLDLRGNFYAQVTERDRLMYPRHLKPLHPDRVRVRRNTDGLPEYRVNGTLVPIDDVFHVRGLSGPGDLVGMNTIEVCRMSLGLARDADAYGASYFQNASMPSGVISVPGDLDEDETRMMGDQWNQLHQGLNAAHQVAVITGGATYAPISITPEDAQFIQSRQFSRAEIAMIFRIPPHMIGDVDRTTSWGTGIEQQEIGFDNRTITPITDRIQAAFNAITPRGQYVEFDTTVRQRSDFLTRMQGATLARNASVMTINELRKREGLAPLDPEIGDTIAYPMNMGLIDSEHPMMQPVQSGGEPQQPGGLEPGPDSKNPTAGD